MDPIANLNEQRELAGAILRATDALDERREADNLDNDEEIDTLADIVDQARRLVELVGALDEWRRKGGFDPYPREPLNVFVVTPEKQPPAVFYDEADAERFGRVYEFDGVSPVERALVADHALAQQMITDAEKDDDDA